MIPAFADPGALAKHLLDHVGWGVAIGTPDGRFAVVNQAFARMHGRSVDDLVGTTIALIFAPTHREAFAAQLDEIHERGTRTFTSMHLHADGHAFPVLVDATAICDERGELLYRGVYVRELSAEEAHSGALDASELRFRQIVSHSADAILAVDEQGTIVLFNEGAEWIFGYREHEILGRPLDLLLPDRHRAMHHAHVGAFATSGIPSRSMSRRRPLMARRRNGEEFPAQISIAQYVDGGRRVFSAVVRDISVEVRALEEERFLGEVGVVLASSLDVEISLDELGRLAVGHLADACIVEFEQRDGTRVVRSRSRDGAQAERVAELVDTEADRDAIHFASSLWRTRAPELVAESVVESLAGRSPTRKQEDALRALEPRSVLAVPMCVRGEMRGLLVMLRWHRAHDGRDLQVAKGFAERAAAALENASLHDALMHAHAVLADRLRDLEEAQKKIRTLTGLLPVCAWCGLIRDDEVGGHWKRLEQFVAEHSEAKVTHGICPSCAARLG